MKMLKELSPKKLGYPYFIALIVFLIQILICTPTILLVLDVSFIRIITAIHLVIFIGFCIFAKYYPLAYNLPYLSFMFLSFKLPDIFTDPDQHTFATVVTSLVGFAATILFAVYTYFLISRGYLSGTSGESNESVDKPAEKIS